MIKSKAITKYLSQYAEPQVQQLASFPSTSNPFQHVVIIPAYQESIDFIKRFFCSNLTSQAALMVVVVNQPDTDANQAPQQQLWQQALALAGNKVEWQSEDSRLILLAPETTVSAKTNKAKTKLLLVNAFEQPLPAKQGVGLARKIGCDLAANLMAQGIVNTRWLHSSDADASLPDDYFTATHLFAKASLAAVYSFAHRCDDKVIHFATQYYQKALTYYVDGLRYAGSNYAFYTIGSVLAFDVDAYAKVRGFPKRSAGEDFYLLNKLAKLTDFADKGRLTPVSYIAETCIQLEARISARVPFGTGPAVKNIIELEKAGQAYCYYHPEVFKLLKITLSVMTNLAECRDNFDAWLEQLPIVVQQTLANIGFISFVEKHLHDSPKQFTRQLHTWFDAFKTLKFIHALREEGYADIPLTQALEIAEFSK